MATIQGHRPATSSLADRYRVLLDVGRTLTGTRSLEELYRAIYRETSRVLEADGFYISLYDPASDEATIVFFADRGQEQRVEVRYRGSESSVIRQAQPVRVDDRLEKRSLMLLGDDAQEVTRSAISAPLRWKDEVLGAISTQSYLASAFTDADVELLQGVADMAAVAIENARHVELLERRRAEAHEIEEIGRALATSLEPEDVLAKVIDAALELLDGHGGAVWMLGSGTVAWVDQVGGELGLPPGLEWDLEGELYDGLVRRRETVVIDDIAESPFITARIRDFMPGGSGVGAPLEVANEVVGILAIGSRFPRAFSEEDRDVLRRLASQASVALRNARLHASLRALSLTDPLTGLPNRRHLDVHLEREIAAAKRGRDLTAVIADVDHFKTFNDRHGHLAGDQALRAFAGILQEENRAMNLVARYGGDEFVSILSDSADEGPDRYVSRVRRRLREHPFLGTTGLGVTFGVAVFHEGMHRGEDLLRAADQDLYRNKESRAEALRD
ncbi:MAG: diguanylate cyclase [Gemmatimonadota bacterium]|jgi:diguanylate cyclase (GGDEF)-like protein